MKNRKPVITDNKKPMLAAERRRLHLGGRASKIEGDPEMMPFVIRLFDTDTFESIARKCAERFGPALAPGKSAVHRFWTNYFKAQARHEYATKHRAARARKN